MRFAKVLKPFAYAHDGIRAKQLSEGEVFQCQDDVFPGLAKEGFVEESSEGDLLVPVEIPEGWANLADADKLALASAIAGKKVKKVDAAAEVITAELARRAA